MEAPVVTYEKSEYIETATGNKAIIKPGAIIRGDLANVNIGRHCVVGSNSVIRPPYKKFKGGIAFFPLTIGNHVMIEDDCIIEAASIGSFVQIGKGSVISRRCILKDCCRILPNTVLPPDTVVPSFAVFGGSPGTFQEELTECFEELQKEATITNYKKFQPRAAAS